MQAACEGRSVQVQQNCCQPATVVRGQTASAYPPAAVAHNNITAFDEFIIY